MKSLGDFVKKYREPDAMRKFLMSIVGEVHGNHKSVKLYKVLNINTKNLQDVYQHVYDGLVNGEYKYPLSMDFIHGVYTDFGSYSKELNRLGRPPLTDTIPIQEIMDVYEETNSVRKTAKILETSHPTISKHLREAGVKLKKKPISPHTGKIANWLRDNPGTPLPGSYDEIAKVTGASPSAVRGYLRRRKLTIMKDLEANPLPNLNQSKLAIKIEDGEVFKLRNLQSYTIEVDNITLKLRIFGYTNTGRFIDTIPLISLENLRASLK